MELFHLYELRLGAAISQCRSCKKFWVELDDFKIQCFCSGCTGYLISYQASLSSKVANIPLAFLEPTISKWMENVMDATPFQKGFGGHHSMLINFLTLKLSVWFPAFIPHVCGVMICVALANKYFRFQWFYGAVGLAFIAISTAFLPVR